MREPAIVHKNALARTRTDGGFCCPKCGTATAVGDSRPHRNAIKRRRYCKCGFRFTTFEHQIDEAPEFVEMVDALTGLVSEISASLMNLAREIDHIHAVAANLRELNEPRLGGAANRQKQKEPAI